MKNRKFLMASAIIVFSIVLSMVAMAAEIAQAPSYKADTSYATNAKAAIVYMAMTSKDDLCVLFSDSSVKIFDSEGKEKVSFQAEQTGKAGAIATDDIKIYVATTDFDREVFKKEGGKIPKGKVYVNCGIYDMAGKKEKSVPIEGVLDPSSMRFIKDKLVIADRGQCALLICDPKTGKIKKSINDGIRICCGIFDFCEGPNDTILVANLGAFKVSSFTTAGGSAPGDFGKRGNGIDDFHGCCNPVSLALLPDGSIVTVEKDTTRVKVYDKKGKKASLISGIDELVKGCTHIPMVTDSKGNVYLGSKASNKIVKCIPEKEVAAVKSK